MMILLFLFVKQVFGNPSEDVFRIIPEVKTWYDARDHCEDVEGAKLAIFDDEIQFQTHAAIFVDTKVWTGIYDESESDNAGRVWKSSDNQDPGFIIWGINRNGYQQPESSHKAVCVTIEPGEGVLMQDRPCSRKTAPLCRYYKHYPKYERVSNYSVEYLIGSAADNYFRKGMKKIFLKKLLFKIEKLIVLETI